MDCAIEQRQGKTGAAKGEELTAGAICRLVNINSHINLGGVDEPAQEVPPQNQHHAGARRGHTVKYGHC